MADTIIENPILNSPFREPDRHWRFDDEGITNEIVETRRASAYFVPIPPPKKKGKQLQFDTEWTQDRIEPNDKVNRIRRTGQALAGRGISGTSLRSPASSCSTGPTPTGRTSSSSARSRPWRRSST